MNGAHENRVVQWLRFVSVGFLVSVGCQGASPPTVIAVACPGVQHENPNETEIRRCCERRVVSRLRAACVSEALQNRGVCAQHSLPPPDAGSRDASRDLGMPRDAGPRDSGHDMSAPHDASARDASLDLRASRDANPGNDAGIGGCGLVISSITAAETVPAGSVIPVSVSATDSDPAAILRFVWSSSNVLTGNPPPSASVNIPCVGVPTINLSVTVSDGICQQTASTIITCAPTCGDGIVEPGEQCDPPRTGGDGLQCGPNCQLLTCGNFQIDPGEQCDPPQAHICSLTCQNVPATCGDGILQVGEECDPPRTGPDGLQCGPDCHYLTCGNGVIDPGEQCDPPRSLSGPVSQGFPPLCSQSCQIPTCGNLVLDPGEQCDPPDGLTCNAQCQTIPTVCGDGLIQPGETCDFPIGPFCLGCQITACGRCFFASLGPKNVNDSNTDFACQALTGTARTTCQALLACMTASFSNCITSQLALRTACYCSDATCSASVNGRCVAQIDAVAGTTDSAIILGELNDQTSLLSQVRAEAQRFSTSSCGFTCLQFPPP
jgi:hypothetical protein